MSIGLIAAGIRLLNDQLKPSSGPQQGAAPPVPSEDAPAKAGTGSSDPFRQLSADIQAKLLQLQATGADATQASAALGKAMKPHHLHRKEPDASGSLVPAGAKPGTTTTAGATSDSGNVSLVEAVRQAMKAYSAAAANNKATAPLATV